MAILLKRTWGILTANRIAYLALNLLYYGLILSLMTYAAFDAPLQTRTLESNPSSFMNGALSIHNPAAIDASVFRVLGSTYLSNVLAASYGGITFPSFIIPFIGIFFGLYRAVLLGIAFSPFNASISGIFIVHLPTLFIEGQAFILAMLGAYIHGRAMIWPSSVGKTGRWKAYVEGIRQSGSLYIFIMAIFLVSALYGLLETAILIR
jgi:hypothetical protein